MTLIITDIDQTVTVAGIDLWHEITKEIIPEAKHDEYLEHLQSYKKNVIQDPINESKLMMEYAINLFPSNKHYSLYAIEVYTRTFDFVKNLKQNNGIREFAVEYLTEMLENNAEVVFSTANYIEGATAVRDALFEDNEALKGRIKVSGSVVNWDNREVVHINVADNKVLGLEHVLQKTEKEIKQLSPLIFGDDPVINDIAIFKLSENSSYLMETPKNVGIEIPDYIKRSSWESVYRDTFALL